MTVPFVSVVAHLGDADPLPFARAAAAAVRPCCGAYEIILVDDASDTPPARFDAVLAAVPAARVVRLARRYGPDVSLKAGLDSAVGDCVVLMEAGCDPPADIPAMLLACRRAGVVTGVARDRPGEGAVRRLARRLVHAGLRRLFGGGLPADATRFQTLGRPAAAAVGRVRTKRPQFPVPASQVGGGGAVFAYRRCGPSAGGRGWGGLLDRGLAAVVLAGVSPLRLIAGLGLAGGGLNLLYVGYVVAVNLARDHVAEGWTTLSLQASGMFFLVFLVLALMCEYVGRTLEEAGDRPIYDVIEERSGSELLPLDDRPNVLDRSA